MKKKCVGKKEGKHCCLKDFRSAVKNQLVFPNIYLASYRKVADAFGLASYTDDFKKKTSFKVFDKSGNGNHAEIFETQEDKISKSDEFNKLARPAKII